MLPPVPKAKPWHRLRYWALGFALLIAATIVWMVLETRAVQHGQPNVTTDYRKQFRSYVEQHTQLGPGDGAEAWEVMVQMLDRTAVVFAAISQEAEAEAREPRFEGDEFGYEFAYVLAGPSIPENIDPELRLLAQLKDAGVLELAARFSELAPGYDPTPTQGMILAEQWTYLSTARRFTQAQAAMMRLAFEAGDYEQLVASLEQTLALYQTIALQPTIIHSLVAAAMNSLVLQEVRYQLLEGSLPLQTRSAMFDVIERYALPSAAHALKGEQMLIHDMLQHAFTDNGNGNGYMIGSEDAIGMQQIIPPSFATAFLSRYALADRRETREAFDRIYGTIIEELEKPASLRWQTMSLDDLVENLSWKHSLVKMMVPAADRAGQNIDAAEAERHATLLLVAIELHHAQHGEFPATLDALVPEIVPELPVDAVSGKPFGYRLVDNDEHGRPYLLYSFGLDGEDNAGAMHPESGMTHLAVTKKDEGRGYDRVFNLPRRDWNVE